MRDFFGGAAMKRRRRNRVIEWKQCQCGKRGYRSMDAARRGTRGCGHAVRAYPCPRSGLWHITKQKAPE